MCVCVCVCVLPGLVPWPFSAHLSAARLWLYVQPAWFRLSMSCRQVINWQKTGETADPKNIRAGPWMSLTGIYKTRDGASNQFSSQPHQDFQVTRALAEDFKSEFLHDRVDQLLRNCWYCWGWYLVNISPVWFALFCPFAVEIAQLLHKCITFFYRILTRTTISCDQVVHTGYVWTHEIA